MEQFELEISFFENFQFFRSLSVFGGYSWLRSSKAHSKGPEEKIEGICLFRRNLNIDFNISGPAMKFSDKWAKFFWSPGDSLFAQLSNLLFKGPAGNFDVIYFREISNFSNHFCDCEQKNVPYLGQKVFAGLENCIPRVQQHNLWTKQFGNCTIFLSF